MDDMDRMDDMDIKDQRAAQPAFIISHHAY